LYFYVESTDTVKAILLHIVVYKAACLLVVH